jgi:hypothetical protein
MFRKLDLFPSPGEARETPLMGPLERANLNHLRSALSQSLEVIKTVLHDY